MYGICAIGLYYCSIVSNKISFLPDDTIVSYD